MRVPAGIDGHGGEKKGFPKTKGYPKTKGQSLSSLWKRLERNFCSSFFLKSLVSRFLRVIMPPSSDRFSSHISGFTLVEVAIVIFIMVMMTSITVPWMKTFAESSRLRSTARSIRSLMEFAQNSAVSQRTEYVVMFDSEQGEYWLSLLDLLEQGSGGSVTDSSRTSLSESLAALSESEENSSEDSTDLTEEKEEVEGAYSRTGGILGIPRQLPASVSIAQIVSPRTTSGDAADETDYIVFYPDGTAEDFEVYLRSQSGRTFLLDVTQATGRAAIRELSTEEVEELGLETGE